MAVSSGHWAFAFGLLGNIVSFMVYLAPLAMLWIYYGLLKSDNFLITINLFGCCIETIYICFFLFYAPKKARASTMKLLLLLNVIGFGLILLLTHFLAKDSKVAAIVGWICLVISVTVFVAPLCIVRKVIQTKSVEFMPFLLSSFLTLSAVMWFFYGLLVKDYKIAIPNVLGFIFGVLQMVLYAVYRNAKTVVKGQKLPHELQNQIIVQEDLKLPELIEGRCEADCYCPLGTNSSGPATES
ncbi:hypothetical protein F0562_024425 [Nyssa sinensis]|uniref:Bidirectional sugar transporter SWEET n=1 Tax=Nyssa sinensis TaxID=561372 RepID=A0A5J5BDL1_9ASTE|nr:hypothetical protein F0562_024425 [Nyssa sinensis]